ncbi:hypothetical protein HYH03_017584 [Edaphochlamys debaryana]|uniref:EF-hand domain-containing protein n=1 Tax=Edaphochlamys debaryana TaxID=47281 RepID=A0A835XI75_9CHLO|nr:hypothetical protein HYH03_017584 [Edaphochlamys debaryana]|eukprot:KAG2483577.1 hypothetical protein HYH03_017584 [Edaphochlamys debaryana]
MGCLSSRPSQVDEDSPLSAALETALVNAIMTTKRRKSFKVKKSSFNNLMLQMPRLVAGFRAVREAHATATGGQGKITWGAFRTTVGESMGLDPNSASLAEVLALPDVAEGVPVTHADLVVIFTVIHLLDSAAKRRTIRQQEVRACLELMEKSFMFFDSSADGCIERKELAMALKSGTRVFGRKASKSLADRLFDQLDWSKDGQITFKEYLIGMERIIMETAGEEDEDGLEADEDDELDMDEADMDTWDEKGDAKGKLAAGGHASTRSVGAGLAAAGAAAGHASTRQGAAAAAGAVGAAAKVVTRAVPPVGNAHLMIGAEKSGEVLDEVRPFTGTGMLISTGHEHVATAVTQAAEAR